ncbi:MAG TPA: tetratricopeptide repeat protein [Geobacteraceae bacterium]
MGQTESASFFDKGVEALQHNHLFLARVCFEQAALGEKTPAVSSYLALCRAKTRGEYDVAMAMVEEALALEPRNAVHYLNLGRIQLMAGNKPQALDTFRRGARFDRSGEIGRELERLGVRKRPVFPFLARSNPLNRYVGLFLARIGLR